MAETMTLTLEKLPEDHNRACVVCNNERVRGDRRADWLVTVTHVRQGTFTDGACDTHLETQFANIGEWARILEDRTNG